MQFKRTIILPLSILLASAALAQDLTRPSLPTDNLPVQKIGREDLLGIQVYDSPELTRSVRVNANGEIRLPMLKNPIRVDGLLPADVEVLLADALKSDQILVDPFVTVTIIDYHSHPISVTGAVKTPTIFQAVGNVHLLDALARAGGFDDKAGGDIIVTRPNGDSGAPSVQRIPMKTLFQGSSAELNVPLVGGEEIRVPFVDTVVVSGNVKESGVFPVQDTGTTTVLTAIAQAKGLGDFQPKMVYIYRRDEQGNRHEIPVDLKAIKARKQPDVVLQAKDVLYVPDNNRAKMTATVLDKVGGSAAGIPASLIYVMR